MAVGVWGWVLNGALIGYGLSTTPEKANEISKRNKNKARKSSTLPASSGALAMLFGVLGFALACIPFNADAKFKSATIKADLNLLMKSVELPGTSQLHLSQVLSSAVSNNFSEQAKVLDNRMLNVYPRDVYGWKILYYSTSSTPEVKAIAVKKLHELDPFNPDLPKS